MKVYHGAFKHSSKFEFQHFGSIGVGLRRLESMFLSPGEMLYHGGEDCYIAYPNRPPIKRPLKSMFEDFADTASSFSIREYDVHISNPLLLNDLWGDDPIGSGGFKVIAEQNKLSAKEIEGLKRIFGPFYEQVEPAHVYANYTAEQTKKIKKQYSTNLIYQNELKKRKARAKALGLNFSREETFETIWLDLSMKLRGWCLANGYDGLEYKNFSEGNGEVSIVSLTSSQVKTTNVEYAFNKDRYLEIVMPLFMQYFLDNRKMHSFNKPIQRETGGFWVGHTPETFIDKLSN